MSAVSELFSFNFPLLGLDDGVFYDMSGVPCQRAALRARRQPRVNPLPRSPSLELLRDYWASDGGGLHPTRKDSDCRAL